MQLTSNTAEIKANFNPTNF